MRYFANCVVCCVCTFPSSALPLFAPSIKRIPVSGFERR